MNAFLFYLVFSVTVICNILYKTNHFSSAFETKQVMNYQLFMKLL